MIGRPREARNWKRANAMTSGCSLQAWERTSSENSSSEQSVDKDDVAAKVSYGDRKRRRTFLFCSILSKRGYFWWIDQSHIAVELEIDKTQKSGIELQKGGHDLEINVRWILQSNPFIAMLSTARQRRRPTLWPSLCGTIQVMISPRISTWK